MEYCWNAIRTRSLWQINCLGSYRNMMQFQINSRKQNRQRDTWIIKIRVLEKVFRKQFCFIKCRRQHLQVTELRSYSKFTFAENTNANLPEVLRTKFLGSDGFFCFISTCKFGSFKNPFAMITSLSELYFRFRRSILLLQKKIVIFMNYGSSTTGLSMNGMWLHSHTPTHASIYLDVLMLYL